MIWRRAAKLRRLLLVELGRAGIRFGVRAGAPKPDVRTPDAVKQTLLDAEVPDLGVGWRQPGPTSIK